MTKLAAVLTLVLGLAAVVRAEPLDSGRVAADAQWVVHLDFDALKAAATAQKIGDAWLGRELSKRKLEWLRENVGLDPTRDLHGATLYGTRIVAGSGAGVIHAKVDRERLLAFLQKQPDYRSGSHGDHQLHAWTHRCGDRRRRQAFVCLHRPRMIVFAHSEEELHAALDVLDGKAASLAGTDSPLVDAAPPGTIVQVAAKGLGDAELPFRSSVIRLSVRLSMAMGESAGEAFLHGELETQSTDAASEIRDLAAGLRSAATLLAGSDAELRKLLAALKVVAAEQVVRVDWRAPAEQVWNVLESGRNRMAHHRRQSMEELLQKYDTDKNGKLDDDEKNAMRAEWFERMQELKKRQQAP